MCYAVIFTSTHTPSGQEKVYDHVAERMRELAMEQPGCRAINSVCDGDKEITISYWDSLEAIKAWKNHPSHLQSQQLGKQSWYSHYKVEVTKVEQAYEFGNQ